MSGSLIFGGILAALGVVGIVVLLCLFLRDDYDRGDIGSD